MKQDLVDAESLLAEQDGCTTISADIPCVECEYNLRTLSTSSRCPECGRPVDESLRFYRENSLWLADRRWLRKLRAGTTLMFVAAIGLTISLFLEIWLDELRQNGFVIHLFIGRLGVVILWGWGVFLVTASQPRATEATSRKILRWFTRLCSVVALLPLLYLLSLLVFGVRSSVSPDVYMRVVNSLLILLSMLPFFNSLAVCLYCRPMGKKGYRPGLGRLNTIIACLLGFGLPVWVFLLVALRSRPSWVPIYMGRFGVWGMLLLYLVCFILGIISLIAHRRMFNRILAFRTSEASSDETIP